MVNFLCSLPGGVAMQPSLATARSIWEGGNLCNRRQPLFCLLCAFNYTRAACGFPRGRFDPVMVRLCRDILNRHILVGPSSQPRPAPNAFVAKRMP